MNGGSFQQFSLNLFYKRRCDNVEKVQNSRQKAFQQIHARKRKRAAFIYKTVCFDFAERHAEKNTKKFKFAEKIEVILKRKEMLGEGEPSRVVIDMDFFLSSRKRSDRIDRYIGMSYSSFF